MQELNSFNGVIGHSGIVDVWLDRVYHFENEITVVIIQLVNLMKTGVLKNVRIEHVQGALL